MWKNRWLDVNFIRINRKNYYSASILSGSVRGLNSVLSCSCSSQLVRALAVVQVRVSSIWIHRETSLPVDFFIRILYSLFGDVQSMTVNLLDRNFQQSFKRMEYEFREFNTYRSTSCSGCGYRDECLGRCPIEEIASESECCLALEYEIQLFEQELLK